MRNYKKPDIKRNILQMIDGELKIGTFDLSKGFHVPHRMIKKDIITHIIKFEKLGTSPILKYNRLIPDSTIDATLTMNPPGRPIEEFMLNKLQILFLLSIIRAKSIGEVIDFKMYIITELDRQEKLISSLLNQRSNASFIAKRKIGKLERRIETDTIKRFIQYAKNQGSLNAERYYMIISKMQNQTLFNLEFIEQKKTNIRDIVSGLDLDKLKMSDYIVERAIDEGMSLNLHYKSIYELARDRVETFASAIGKSPLYNIIGIKTPSRDEILV